MPQASALPPAFDDTPSARMGHFSYLIYALRKPCNINGQSLVPELLNFAQRIAAIDDLSKQAATSKLVWLRFPPQSPQSSLTPLGKNLLYKTQKKSRAHYQY
jgi:hypothetical protein